ncbi:MAG: metal-dependent transcriptional regulator [Candidatus Eremiobacteraeota bacterium]|nr:metal-dependent transcriptional regulator [Candidatus Eremiobacteraeota bacterium]
MIDKDERDQSLESPLCDICKHHAVEIDTEIDELLETIWVLREKGKVTENHYRESGAGNVILDNLDRLKKMNLIYLKEGHVTFTDGGEKHARDLIRRHRLTERMLTDLFDIPRGRIEAPSCQFEHILSEEVTDSICSFLGHPSTCPHGRPIPPGECCKKLTKTITPLVIPLVDLMPGEKGRIVFIATKDRRRLRRLSSLGINPEGIVTVNQKLPTVVIHVDETEIAMDHALVSEIYVKRITDNG